ncbi:restriction endonuclease subunit S [Actinomadura spongiicola]|uniref:Restriction endonuclease subunit S n=1 Tax=Actinomadura spongiicola TaxID=2303421 RepID=A0A372G7T4_9ACTN|nr:restriction endonuclease subunit S [Actinomadura spongiicola]RFS81436.1 restriction endonuclease subunit S [Actinomadura spongiicola]
MADATLPDVSSLPPLPEEWTYVALEELLEPKGISYGIVQPGASVPDGIPIIRVKDLKGGRVVQRDPLRVSPEVEAKYSRTRLRGGEVLLSLVGSVGETAIATDELAGWNVARAIGVLRAANQVSAQWIRTCLSAEVAQRYMQARLNTTVQATLNLRDVRKIPIVVPPQRDRKAITAILEVLDDKLSLNERIAITADSLISASMQEVAMKMPGEFTEQALSSMADFVNGRAFTKGASGAGRMVVRIAEINSGPGPSTVYNDIDVPDRHLARPGDVLFSWSGSLTVARWYRQEAIINQHIFKVVPRGDRPMWLVAELVRSKLAEFRAIAADKATTMGHIQRRHLDGPVVAPSVAMTRKLDAHLGPLWDRALSAEQESLRLAALRGTLLPQLMSGKLRVRDAERILEDAV